MVFLVGDSIFKRRKTRALAKETSIIMLEVSQMLTEYEQRKGTLERENYTRESLVSQPLACPDIKMTMVTYTPNTSC